jgi:hypothetical protein
LGCSEGHYPPLQRVVFSFCIRRVALLGNGYERVDQAKRGDDLDFTRKEERSASFTSRWHQIAKDKAVALHDVASLAGDRLCKHRPGVDEGMELAVLTTGIDFEG